MSEIDGFVLAVGLDGVCAEYTLGFRTIVADRLGVAPESLPLERSPDFREWGFGPGELEAHRRHAVVERRMYRSLDVVAGAADALWRLSDAGVWIRIVTQRLAVNWGHQAAVTDTVAWLDEARIPYRDLCFLGAKPRVEADLYLADSADNVTALRGAGNDVVVYDRPDNRSLDEPRAMNWAEVEEIVLERYTQWSGVHGVQPTLPGVVEGDRLFGRRPGSGR